MLFPNSYPIDNENAGQFQIGIGKYNIQMFKNPSSHLIGGMKEIILFINMFV